MPLRGCSLCPCTQDKCPEAISSTGSILSYEIATRRRAMTYHIGGTMEYRHLGRTGIRVSELSFGSWVTFHNQVDVKAAIECMSAGREAGVNFFDNAEVYAHGRSEEIMGEALKKLGWGRGSYLVSTKFYW